MEKHPSLKEFMECYNLHLINNANLTCSMIRLSDRYDWLTCGDEVEGARLKRGKKQFGSICDLLFLFSICLFQS